MMAKISEQLKRPKWLDSFLDYPHRSLSVKEAREICWYATSVQDQIVANLSALTAVHEANERREIILPTKTAALVWEALLLAHNGNVDALRVAENDNDATGEK